MKLLLPLFFISVVLLAFTVLKNTGITSQKEVANWNDGTDAFYQQLLKSTGDWEENAGEAVFDNQEVRSISEEETEVFLANAQQAKVTDGNQVLGLHTAQDGAEKWVEVDLSDKKLYGWEGNRKVFEFLVSTGRPGYETPTGEYRVWRKVRSQRYKGGTPGTSSYYNLPNVPYSLFFGNTHVPNWKGYAIHGAYWHNDFGIKNRSSGCINVKPEEAGIIYNWAGPVMPSGVNALNTTAENPGIRVVIHE